MPQLPNRREILAIPHGTTHLVATMLVELPELLQPDPWAVIYSTNGRGVAIDGQHAYPGYSQTIGGVITMHHQHGDPQTTVAIDLAMLGEHCPDFGGVSFISNLYFGPQSHVKFDTLVKAGVEIAALQNNEAIPIARHDLDLRSTRLNSFQLPLGSVVREANNAWSLARDWSPLHYSL